MTMPRLIVSDVDRTLLTHDYVLPQRVADAVRVAQDRGTVVVLATARSPLGVRPFAERLGIADLVVAFNGGWIGNVATGSALSQQRISRSDALHAMATAQAAGVRPMWFTGDAVFALMNDPLIAREAAVTREPLFVAETIEALPGEPGKIMCVAGQASDREADGHDDDAEVAIFSIAILGSERADGGHQGAYAHSRDETARAQGYHSRCGGAQDHANGHGDQAQKDHRPSADPVGERCEEQRAEGVREQPERDHQSHGLRRDGPLVHDSRGREGDREHIEAVHAVQTEQHGDDRELEGRHRPLGNDGAWIVGSVLVGGSGHHGRA